MILPGRVAISRNLIQKLLSQKIQVQPDGIDLTLKHVLTWTSAGVIDFDNSNRKTASTSILPFLSSPSASTSTSTPSLFQPPSLTTSGYIDLLPGAYLVEFNETIDMPLDIMGQIFPRSSLFRSGAMLNAGVMDSEYRGTIGAFLQFVNPHGLRLWKDARLAQIVFHEMSEKTEGYSGVYQGRDGMEN